MKPYLLDINVLIALAWPNHVHHDEAVQWFVERRAAGFCTCPLTQAGFARISSNSVFAANAVTPADAMALLARITEVPGHQFWADDLPLGQALGALKMIAGHRQIVDGYLIALAIARNGIVATLDRGVKALAKSRHEANCVELLFGGETHNRPAT
jgi:toxin-antitoxin system PIN domain toxin